MTSSESMPNELIPTRHSLIGRLKNWEEQEAWREFFDTYSGLIFNVAMKAGLTESEANDVVQETLITVARNLKEFRTGSEHGSFKAWLLKTTRWRVVDQFRKRALEEEKRLHRSSEDAGRTNTIEQLADPKGPEIEAVWEREWAEHRTAVALDRLKRTASPKQFQIFQMLIGEGLPAAKVAEVLGVSRTLVYVTKHRLAKQFKSELERIDQESE